ncbi:MAG: hypothetical protein GX660_14985 [Clostridiaceae bacterium]|nr:hypothetical protein [Clostridiaceae bacterium]
MKKRVGIPRALFYFNYYPLWNTFFRELGAEVVLSECTSKRTLDDGTRSCVDEACLPIKIFHGHVVNLKDKVDYLFIPRFTSISKGEYICPKFGGLPDMIKHTFKDLPKVIDTEINLRKTRKNAKRAAIQIGSYFTSDIRRIKIAYKKALESNAAFLEKVKSGTLNCDLLDKKLRVLKKNTDSELNIAVLGHPYNIFDRHINMNLIEKLRDSGVNIITTDMADNSIVNEKAQLLSKKTFWNYGRKAVGSILHYVDRNDIDGIIYLMTFGCGIDAFICDIAERKVRNNSEIPFIVLTLDEHSGEAGMNTRLEAFLDMIRWRQKDENNLSAHG